MPTMKVVELRNRTQLLAGSGEEVHDGDANTEDYHVQSGQTW